MAPHSPKAPVTNVERNGPSDWNHHAEEPQCLRGLMGEGIVSVEHRGPRLKWKGPRGSQLPSGRKRWRVSPPHKGTRLPVPASRGARTKEEEDPPWGPRPSTGDRGLLGAHFARGEARALPPAGLRVLGTVAAMAVIPALPTACWVCARGRERFFSSYVSGSRRAASSMNTEHRT